MKASNKGVQRTRHKVSGPLTPDVGHTNMKMWAIIIMLLSAGCAHVSTTPQSRIIGTWAFQDDIDEYAGLYVYEFTPSGRIIIHDYQSGWELGDTIPSEEYGRWKPVDQPNRAGEVIAIRLRAWKYWSESVFTDDNWLKPISGYKRRTTHLIPIEILEGIPRGEGINKIENSAQQSGPAYPPQGVGSADP